MGIRMQYTLTGHLIGKSLKEFSKLPNSSFSPGGFAMDIPVGGRTVCVRLTGSAIPARLMKTEIWKSSTGNRRTFPRRMKMNLTTVTKKSGRSSASAGMI